MSMSKDRVRFYVGAKYLQGTAIYPVLERAFSIDPHVARELYRQQANGFWIICRPSQFARFLIYRNQANIQNGFIDLHAEIIPAGGNIYDRLASASGVNRCDVKKVVHALNFNGPSLEEHFSMRAGELDVSAHHRRDHY